MPACATDERIQFFRENGYLVIHDLFSTGEMERLAAAMDILDTGRRLEQANGRTVSDMVVEDGATARLQFGVHGIQGSVWPEVCRHPRLAGTARALLGQEICIHHSKLAFKAPFHGSVQYWHQDFGYWVSLGHSRPDMLSAMIMLDEHTEDNACLQVLAGSHLKGVVQHEKQVRDATDDAQMRIPAADMAGYCTQYERIKIVGGPGTLAVWHANTMHASSHNISEKPRRALIVAFNAVGNQPENTGSHAGETPPVPLALSSDDCLSRT